MRTGKSTWGVVKTFVKHGKIQNNYVRWHSSIKNTNMCG